MPIVYRSNCLSTQKRFFVNSGTSTYSRSKLRNFQRSTKAHNTIEVNHTNSSDVWDIFRLELGQKILIPN